MPEIDESEYIVNIELKDQYNNIFYIDNINNYDKSIRLKDGSFNDTIIRHIVINKDIYIINSSIISQVKCCLELNSEKQ
jgi:hypothetical protein